MKTIKHILVLVALVTGMSVQAQTHEAVQPAKGKTSAKKINSTASQESKTGSNAKVSDKKATEAIQQDKQPEVIQQEKQQEVIRPDKQQTENKTSAEKSSTTVRSRKTGSQKPGGKMKEIRRPVKKAGATPAGK